MKLIPRLIVELTRLEISIAEVRIASQTCGDERGLWEIASVRSLKSISLPP